MGQIANTDRVFSEIYARNVWGGSGVGSDPERTTEYVAFLQNFLHEHGIKSVVDYGCGDWRFSQLVDWSGIDYLGFDIVAAVIEENTRRYSAPNIHFEHVKDGVKLPRADLLICKDVLQHLPTVEVRRLLGVFKQLYSHLLITNDVAPEGQTNTDIEAGNWRPLRLDLPPFSEPGALLLTWDVHGFDCQWTKHTIHISTHAAERPAFTALKEWRGAGYAANAVRHALLRKARALAQRLRGNPPT